MGISGNMVRHDHLRLVPFLLLALISSTPSLTEATFGFMRHTYKILAKHPDICCISRTSQMLHPAMLQNSLVVHLASYKSSEEGDETDDDTIVLQKRIKELRDKVLIEQQKQPPNPRLSPTEFITQVLEALRNNVDDPLPDFGCKVLLRSSTPSWKREILKSIGAPPTCADEAQVAASLNNALTRKRNQFGLLVGTYANEGSGEEPYSIQFPSDIVEDIDGETCWVECRLRNSETGVLLVVMGWNLKRRRQDGAWLIDNLDWQDFRDNYRPGVGREEWIRVFG